MEHSLGKRIAAGRKKMGLTQDQLAEKLGVTAQAVSKWENDQSCPDITMLPKLAAIFGTSTDALLGMEKETVHEAEVVEEDQQEPEGLHFENGNLEFHLGGGRRGSLGLALWVLLTGVLALYNYFTRDFGYAWDVGWPSAMLVFGLMGLYPKFSLLRLIIAFFGGAFLLQYYFPLFALDSHILWPVFLVLLGIYLLHHALKKSKKRLFSVRRNGSDRFQTKSYTTENGCFVCDTSFGEEHRRVEIPRLNGGEANVSFGELEVDLTGCEEFAPGCQIDLNCSFGELKLLVPRTCRVAHSDSASFASVEVKGYPNADASQEISVICNASFGEIQIRYI